MGLFKSTLYGSEMVVQTSLTTTSLASLRVLDTTNREGAVVLIAVVQVRILVVVEQVHVVGVVVRVTRGTPEVGVVAA